MLTSLQGAQSGKEHSPAPIHRQFDAAPPDRLRAGRSGVVADMTVSHVSGGAKKQLLTFTAEAESRRRPGAIIAAPIGAATSVAVSAAAAVSGVAAEKLSADVQAQARSLGHAAGERIVAYAKERGWLAPAAVAAAPGEKAGM